MPKKGGVSGISMATAQDIVRAWNLPHMKRQQDVFEYLGLCTDSGTMSFYRQQAEEMTGIMLKPHENKYNKATRIERANLPEQMEKISVTDHPYGILVFSDAHFEGEETVAFKIMLKVLRDLIKTKEIKCIIANGDMMDLKVLSTFAKLTLELEPASRTVQQEILDSQKQLNKLQKVINSSKSPIMQLATFGNHEERLAKWISRFGRQFEDFEGFRMDVLFPDWQWSYSFLLDDTVVVKHNMRSGIHAGYQNSWRAGINIITGHTHQLNTRSFATYSATNIAVQTGHLSEQYHPYLKENIANDWQNGFAVVMVDPTTKTIHPELVYVNNHDRSAFFRGKKYSA